MTTATNDVLLARLDAMSAQMAMLVERQKKQEELIDELVMPIAREVMKTATSTLDDAEKKGYFAFGRELMGVGQRIVEHYTPDDVRQLGDAVTTILDTVRALTQPEVLAIAGDASEVLAAADSTEPIGLLGMVRATRNDDVGRGIALMLEVLRRVGKGAHAMAETHAQGATKRSKVNALLAPRRKKALGTERSAAPRNGNGAAKAQKQLPAPAGGAAPNAKQVAAAVIDGVAFTQDGHLADPTVWTRGLGDTLAQAQAVPMSDAHWKVVEFARGDWEANKASPNIRRITQATELTTRDLYTLFPKAPARTIAKIAGIPKPAGCL